MELWNGYLWFACSNGLYYIKEKNYYNPTEDIEFLQVPNIDGNVWGLNLINDQLFCGHENGAFTMNKALKPQWYIEGIGTWMFTQMSETIIAVGTYTGVYTLEYKNNSWISGGKVKGLDESCRIMVKDNNQNLWIAHPYLKIYKIRFNNELGNTVISEYDQTSGLQTNLRNYVFEIDGQCYVSNETGVYMYDVINDKFSIAEKFESAYPAGNYLRSIVKRNGNTWAISHAGTHYIEFEGGKLTQHPTEITNTNENYIGGFENLFAYNDNTLLTCSDNGVVQFSNGGQLAKPKAPKLTSRLLADNQDSILYNGFGPSTEHLIGANQNTIRFDFASLDSKSYATPFYRYLLEGHDTEWSPWTPQNFKEYYQLEPGEYNFMVRAVAPDSSESEITNFRFSIDMPWSQSWWAVIFYFLCLLFIGLLLLLIPRKRYQKNTNILEAEKAEVEAQKEVVEKEKNRIAYEKEKADLEIQEAQRKMELLEKEKLESEILFKNKELAMSTMNLLQKNETLDAIRTQMEYIEKKVKDTATKKEIKNILSLLRSDDRLEDEWNNFSIHFDQAHHDFLKRLKNQYPKLTPKDQKLCAYLRMNLSTKEIAPLLKISVRGVEISRYRLRKKIELDKEINLNDFMMSF